METNHSEADAVVGDALVNAQLVDERTGQREIDIIAVFLDGYNGSKFFYNSGKHILNIQ
jgi:hypothetical protein